MYCSRHGCHCAWGDTRHRCTVDMPVEACTKRQAQLRAELRALRRLGEALGPPGGENEEHHRKALMTRLALVDNLDGVNTGQRRRLLQQHTQEVEQLLTTRHTELGWTANDDGCGAVVSLGVQHFTAASPHSACAESISNAVPTGRDRESHQKHCYKALSYETSCIRHAAMYWMINTAFILLWVVLLLPAVWRCQDDTAAALRGEGFSGRESNRLAEMECRVWTHWKFPYAIGWVVQLVLGCISATHWAFDLLMIKFHANSIARQQRLRLLPDGCCSCSTAQSRDGHMRVCWHIRLAESWSFAIVLLVGGSIATLWVVWDLGFL